MARGLFGKEFSFYAVETKLFQAMSAMLTIKTEIQLVALQEMRSKLKLAKQTGLGPSCLKAD